MKALKTGVSITDALAAGIKAPGIVLGAIRGRISLHHGPGAMWEGHDHSVRAASPL